MTEKTLNELKEMIGESEETIVDFEVEAGKVEEFSRAVKDDNPIHRSLTEANKQGFNRIPAPLTFTRTSYFPRYRPDNISNIRPFDLGWQRQYSVHGEQEYVFNRPLFVGDILSAEVTINDVYKKRGSRGGEMTFVEYEYNFTDENNETVVTVYQTAIETSGISEGGGRND